MKGLSTLIKLSKRQLDELRKQMVALENEKSQLQEAVNKLHEELRQELKLASEQTEMRGFFGDFAKRIQKRQDDLAREIKAVDKKIAKLNDEIIEAFSSLKKYEIAQANDKRRQEAAQARKDTIVLDEIAGQQHRRKQMSDER